MRQSKWLALLLAGLLVLSGCGQAAEPPEETPPPAVEAPVEPVETPEEPAPNALTAEEVARVNEAFEPTYEKDGLSYANPICCFFTSCYERPEDIDLGEFLRHFSPGTGVTDEVEFQAIQASEDCPRGFAQLPSLDRMPVPISKYRRTDVDAYLEKYAGITTAELSGVRCGDTTMVYLEKYDAYYNFVSDFGPGVFECQSGAWEDENTVRLTAVHSELVLERREGNWYFVQHLPLEEPVE